MSSESSTSSKFGLYRTIDARTEEFLRLSRKRQMRQGCVCAAISTAITVAVVISIVLIYEYSNISNVHTLKSNWLGLMNETVDSLPFDTTQLNKAKLKFDHTTIELLPILLKAFQRNKYYDKEIEDSSSPSPIYDTQDTTEHPKNIFADARNWMKMPTSRVYAIEYKTSPIMLFKSPTRNVEYFTKIRKIRDYKRIMNYVDKMISDKAGSAQSLNKRDYRGYEKRFITSEITTPMPKSDMNKAYHKKTNNIAQTNKRTNNCNCSTRMGETIRKIISTLQKLLPYFASNPIKDTIKPCATEKPKTVTEPFSLGLITPFTVRGNDLILTQELTTTPIPYQKRIYSHETNLEKSIKNSASDEYFETNPKHEPALNTIIKLLKPKNPKAQMGKNVTYYGKEKFQSYYHLGNVLPIRAFNKNNSDTSTTVKPIASYIFNRNKLDEHSFQILPTSNPMYIDDNDTDYTERTTNIVDIFDILDTHSLELVKKVMVSGRSHKKAKPSVVSKQPLKSNIIQPISRDPTKSDRMHPMFTQKMASNDTLHPPEKVNNMLATITSALNTLAMNDSIININKLLRNDGVVMKSVPNETISISNAENALQNSVQDTQPISYSSLGGMKPSNEQDRLEDITIEEEMERTADEYSDEESAIRNIENILNSLKNDTTTQKPKNGTADSSEMYQWELIKIEEHAKNLSNTIMGQNRPTYLEIQRNDWKRDDNTEYDTNINNYVFE